MNEEESQAYHRALRAQNAERHALWEILQELVGRYATSTDDPEAILKNLADRVMWRLDQRDESAAERGLESAFGRSEVCC